VAYFTYLELCFIWIQLLKLSQKYLATQTVFLLYELNIKILYAFIISLSYIHRSLWSPTFYSSIVTRGVVSIMKFLMNYSASFMKFLAADIFLSPLYSDTSNYVLPCKKRFQS